MYEGTKTKEKDKDKDKEKMTTTPHKNEQRAQENRDIGIEKSNATFFVQRTARIASAHGAEWPLLLKAWNDRPLGYKMTTAAYQATQARMLPFLLIPAAQRSAVFLGAAAGVIQWGTTATYWTAMGTAEQAVRTAAESNSTNQTKPWLIGASDRAKISTYLEAMSLTEIPIRVSCDARDIEIWCKDLPRHLANMIRICFIIGQRVSDFLLLQPHCVAIVNAASGQQFVAITFFEGKVVAKIGPFTIHMPVENILATSLLAAVETAKAKRWHHLFVPPDSTREEQRAILSATMERDVRCIRRGGLQRMALLGHSMEDILLFSKHSSAEMLMRYLEHGRCLISQAIRTAQVIENSSVGWPSAEDSGRDV
jgi:hypothetical protein